MLRHARRRGALLALAAAGTLAAAVTTFAATAGEVAVEVFYREPDIVEAALSPSGRRLAIRTGVGADRLSLAVLDLDAGGQPTIAARFSDADVGDFDWVNDERLLLRLVDLTLGGGEQLFGPGLFSVKHDGSELRELVAPKRPFVGGRRIEREPLDWRHGLLAVPAGAGNEVVVGRYEFDRKGDLDKIIPLRLDVTTQRVQPLVERAPEHTHRWLFDSRGEPRLAIATHAGRTRFLRPDAAGGGWKQIADFPSLAWDYVPRFVDAAGDIYVTTSDGPAGYSVLRRLDLATGRPEAQPLVSTPGFDFRGHLVFSDAPGGTVLGVRTVTDAETTVWFDARMKKLQAAADARLPGRVNRLDCRRCESDDIVVLVTSWSDQEPGHLWVYRPGKDSWFDVGRVRGDVDPRRMGTLDLHRIKARDGLELPVWVTQPAGPAPTQPRPAVVLVHGGPWLRGVSWGWRDDAQFLASRGYVVIEPEFRGSDGYGRRHERAGWRQWGLAMQDDVADAVLWAARQGLVDPARVCIAGGSYGGYSALMGLVRHPELYRCAVAWVAVTDPRLMFEESWRNDMSAEARNHGLPRLIGDPVADAAALAAAAPVEHAARIKAPVLLAFGGEDRRVPIEHGRRMRSALRDAGQEPEWILYPGEGHGWLKPANRYDFARRMENFLARHLK